MASYLLRPVIDPILPWEVDSIENSRFKRILASLLIASLIISIIVPFLPVNKLDRSRTASIPPRLVKMVLEQKKVVKTPPVIPQAEKVKEEEKPEKKPEPKDKVEEVKPIEKKTAKDVARKHIAVFDALADLRDIDDMKALKSNQSLSNDSGKAATVTRSLITKKATQGSGGIQLASVSQSSGTGALAGQNATEVKSNIGKAIAKSQKRTQSGTLKRSSENIQLVFEKHKPAIFALYHRALRKDPTLQGSVNFKIVILANGKVSQCSIVSSELNNPGLEKRLVARIKRINFGALDVATWNDTYLINFFPS